MFPDVLPHPDIEKIRLKLTFSHRWNFQTDTAGVPLDGGQVRLSFSGGPFTPVSPGDFSQGRYNGMVANDSQAEIRGQTAFTIRSPGYVNGDHVISTIDLGFPSGGTLAMQFLYSGDSNSRPSSTNSSPNWKISKVVLAVEEIGVGTNILAAISLTETDGGFTVETDPPLAPDRFGHAIVLSDGWLAVGAPRDDQTALQAGAVHLYQRTNSASGEASFIFRQSILSPLNQAEAAFGTSVALEHSTLLIGAPGLELDGRRHRGATFVYRLEGSNWRNVGQIEPAETSEGEFGTAVALGSGWAAAGSRYSRAFSSLADRVAIHQLSLPGGALNARRSRDGAIELRISGELGRNYILQSASNLAAQNWTDLAPLLLLTPATNLFQPAETLVPRFYRLKSLQEN
jgi:hypothetical protein